MKANKILTALVFTTLITGVPAFASTHAKATQEVGNQERREQRQERKEGRDTKSKRGERNERGEQEEREEGDERDEREESPEEQAQLAREAKISMEQARAIALQRAQGNIEDGELERENGKLVYSFDIRNAKGTITEVQVSAIDGQVVSVEEENAQQEAAEKRKEAQEQRQQGGRRKP